MGPLGFIAGAGNLPNVASRSSCQSFSICLDKGVCVSACVCVGGGGQLRDTGGINSRDRQREKETTIPHDSNKPAPPLPASWLGPEFGARLSLSYV